MLTCLIIFSYVFIIYYVVKWVKMKQKCKMKVAMSMLVCNKLP